jgi:acetyl-CoA acetyltransferase
VVVTGGNSASPRGIRISAGHSWTRRHGARPARWFLPTGAPVLVSPQKMARYCPGMTGAAPGVAISGLGITELGRVYGRSAADLAAEAVRLAAADAGIALSEVDGLLVCPGITGGLGTGLAAMLGLTDLDLLATVNSYGASACVAVQFAALAIGSGSVHSVACVFADVPLRPGERAGQAYGPGEAAAAGHRPERHGLAGLAAGYGYRNVTTYYALAARRHMETYGTTSDQFGAIAVAQRQWAAGNPLAQFRKPITLADHQASRWIAEPLHLLDCSVVSNGAIAVIVATADRAAAGPRPPVHVWGWGQGHPGYPMRRGSQFGLVTGAVQAGKTALARAGISVHQVSMCQLYDCYTYTVLVTLEDYGFCAKGEGGPFATSGALAPGGSLPVNTGGGQLSAYYMWGFTPLSEAVIQARGDGGARQAPHTDVILVSGNGGILDHHGTLVLSPHRRQ